MDDDTEMVQAGPVDSDVEMRQASDVEADSGDDSEAQIRIGNDCRSDSEG